jgi:hypothetical protein
MNSKVRGVGVGGWGQGSIQHHLGKSIHLVLTSPGVPHLHPPSPHQPWCTPSSESALCRCFCPLVLCHVLICPPPPTCSQQLRLHQLCSAHFRSTCSDHLSENLAHDIEFSGSPGRFLWDDGTVSEDFTCPWSRLCKRVTRWRPARWYGCCDTNWTLRNRNVFA